MLKCPISEWPEKAIGQKVSINNKNGILRFVGRTDFAGGIWCGIELEEGTGDNDGIVNNVQYFTCSRNHGIFIPASDLVFSENGSVINNLISTDHFSDRLSNTNFVAKNYNSSITLNDSQSVSPKILDEKNKSYTISKEAPDGKLSTITEEMVESMCSNPNSISYLDIENELNKRNTFLNEVCSSIQNEENSVFQKSFEEHDSNDSLGILPLQMLEDTQFGDNSILKIDNTKKHLNSNMNLLNSSEKWPQYQNLSNDNDFLFPSTSLMPKYPILSKNDECPTNTPKFASTPIHEINYSYIMDEEAVASSDHFLYDLECPINSSETFLGKHLEFVLNKTTEMSLNSENISPVRSNECKSRNNDNSNQTPEILNSTCIISDPVNENLTAYNKFNNCAAVEECSIKSSKDLVKFSIQDHPLPDYNNFIQNIVPNTLDVTADCYSRVNEEYKNILNITCNILEPKQIGNEDENILNVTCNILEPKQVGNEDENILNVTCNILEPKQVGNEDENILNVTCNILEPKQIGNEDTENILNVTCNILEPKQIANYTENLDDKNCIPTNILNATASYSNTDEINEIASDKAEILNTTVLYSEIVENNKIPNVRAEILNTTVSYLEKPDNDMVENDNADILNTTYKKIEEPSELEGNVKILITAQPPIKPNENEEFQFGAKSNDGTLNSDFKISSSVCKEKSGKKCSIFDKQLKKSVSCFVKPTSIVNAEYKSKARRNSTSSSLCPISKTGDATVNKARRNSESGSLRRVSKIGESTAFSKNLHGKHPVETNKSIRKSFINRNRLPNINTSFNISRTDFNCLSVKSNFNKDNHEVMDSISEAKLKAGQVITKTESFTPHVPDVCKTVVKKPRLSVQNFTEINHEISDSKLSDNGQIFNKTESFSSHLPDITKTVVKKKQFYMQRFAGYELGKTNLMSEIKDGQVSCLSLRSNFNEDNHEVMNSISEDKLKAGQVVNETESCLPLVPDLCKTVVKKPRLSLQNFTAINQEISESKLTDHGQIFNKTESVSTHLPDIGKTVVKKKRFSMQTFAGYEHEKTNLVSEIKDFQVSKQTKNHLLPDAAKTVVKKPQYSANFGYKSNSQEPCKKPLFKSQDKTVVTANENKSLKLPTIKNRELPVQKPFKDSVIPCLKKPVSSAVTSDERNHQISRIPEKSVLSQKNVLANPASMETKVTNLRKPHSFIPAGKMTAKQGIGKPPALKSSTMGLPATKSDLNNHMPISDQENNFKQTSQSISTTKMFCNKEIDQTSARHSQNSDPNCIKKVGLNETVVMPKPKNNNEENQTLSKSTKPVSRIPSFSQNNRKADAGVKSSLMIPRIAYKGKSHSQHNIR